MTESQQTPAARQTLIPKIFSQREGRIDAPAIINLGVILLLGAIANVMVDWILYERCGHFGQTSIELGGDVTAKDVELWEALRPLGFARGKVERVYAGSGVGCEFVILAADHDNSDDPNDANNIDSFECGNFVSAGWPTLSLFGATFGRNFHIGE